MRRRNNFDCRFRLLSLLMNGAPYLSPSTETLVQTERYNFTVSWQSVIVLPCCNAFGQRKHDLSIASVFVLD